MKIVNESRPDRKGEEITITLPKRVLRIINEELADPKTWFLDKDDFFRFAALKTLDQHKRSVETNEKLRMGEWCLSLLCPDTVYKKSSGIPDLKEVLDRALTEIKDIVKSFTEEGQQ